MIVSELTMRQYTEGKRADDVAMLMIMFYCTKAQGARQYGVKVSGIDSLGEKRQCEGCVIIGDVMMVTSQR